ncbi:LLM class flavin-dependent oxidoreductase [Actinomadura sp. B10D3]|uniref:LLM class flavin-dependent oxidoreductase n=1 Tax=Actinomadura sp. B10D3 TaxID=3153557 RepID=UPI00325DEDAC
MRLGLPWNGAEVAAEAEAAGFRAFCTGDFADHDAYLNLADMARETVSAEVGTAIAYAFARTPYAHATAARQLHRVAPGRVFLGFGTGAYRINRDWFSVEADRPVARMKELVRAVRAYLEAENGEVVRFEGEHYRLAADIRATVLGRLEIPLLVAGFNAGMARAAGQVADGVVGHGLFTRLWWEETVRPAMADGREAADLSRHAPPREIGWVITAVDDDDPDRAVLDARRMIAFYLTVKTYDAYVERHGWGEPVRRIRAAFADRDPGSMAAAVTDEMVEAIAVVGTARQAQRMLDARGADGLPNDVAFLAPPSYLVSRRRQMAYCRASLRLRSPAAS